MGVWTLPSPIPYHNLPPDGRPPARPPGRLDTRPPSHPPGRPAAQPTDMQQNAAPGLIIDHMQAHAAIRKHIFTQLLLPLLLGRPHRGMVWPPVPYHMV